MNWIVAKDKHVSKSSLAGQFLTTNRPQAINRINDDQAASLEHNEFISQLRRINESDCEFLLPILRMAAFFICLLHNLDVSQKQLIWKYSSPEFKIFIHSGRFRVHRYIDITCIFGGSCHWYVYCFITSLVGHRIAASFTAQLYLPFVRGIHISTAVSLDKVSVICKEMLCHVFFYQTLHGCVSLWTLHVMYYFILKSYTSCISPECALFCVFIVSSLMNTNRPNRLHWQWTKAYTYTSSRLKSWGGGVSIWESPYLIKTVFILRRGPVLFVCYTRLTCLISMICPYSSGMIHWNRNDHMSSPIAVNYLLFKDALQWRHNDHDSVSNHQPHGCLLNRLFRRRSKKTSKLRVTGLCVGNSPGPVNSPHKGPVTRKMFPFDDVIMVN